MGMDGSLVACVWSESEDANFVVSGQRGYVLDAVLHRVLGKQRRKEDEAKDNRCQRFHVAAHV
jgi:hypothetical protein